MPPTLKDSSALPESPKNPERPAENTSHSDEASNAQPVALQVPVTVNGARAVEGSDKREPFSETTTTVLVLANGAVIRLTASVAPGQLLFLTNEKTRKEVICQVVKSKTYRNVSGYVELEFTEPVLGFWGMRFPGDRHVAQSGASLPAARKIDPAALSPDIPPKSVNATSAYTDTKPAARDVTENLADAVEEFKTEIKADSRPQSKADLLAPSESSIDGLKLEANRLQEQLSSLLFAEQKKSEAPIATAVVPPSKQELGDAAAKIFEIAAEPVPSKPEVSASTQGAPKLTHSETKSSFDDEQVKVPAWLEPLARNAAIPAPSTEEVESDSATEGEERQAPELPQSVPSQKPATGTRKSASTTPKHLPSAPVFGKTLLGESNSVTARPRGSGKAMWMGIAAGVILAAAGGAWYFRDSVTSLTSPAAASQSNAPQPSSPAPVSDPVAPSINSGAVTSSSAPIATAQASSSAAQPKVQTAAITERIPKTNSSKEVANAPATSDEIVQPESTRPSLGKVRLAKPKVRRSAQVQANGEIAPALDDNSDALAAGENALGANFAENSNQPAAPKEAVQVGGEVKPARMISSVPPVYPTMAKTQHVSGDVRVDALIDPTGRVTTMKVVSGPSLLQQAAMDALRQWKYQAATLDGKPVAMHLTVTIQFRLQ